MPNTFTGRDLLALVPRPLPATHGALVDALARRVLLRAPPPGLRAAALEFLGVEASRPLLASSPAPGWRLSSLLTLLLDSPTHVSR